MSIEHRLMDAEPGCSVTGGTEPAVGAPAAPTPGVDVGLRPHQWLTETGSLAPGSKVTDGRCSAARWLPRTVRYGSVNGARSCRHRRRQCITARVLAEYSAENL